VQTARQLQCRRHRQQCLQAKQQANRRIGGVRAKGCRKAASRGGVKKRGGIQAVVAQSKAMLQSSKPTGQQANRWCQCKAEPQAQRQLERWKLIHTVLQQQPVDHLPHTIINHQTYFPELTASQKESPGPSVSISRSFIYTSA
jgi:hypothetical protein